MVRWFVQAISFQVHLSVITTGNWYLMLSCVSTLSTVSSARCQRFLDIWGYDYAQSAWLFKYICVSSRALRVKYVNNRVSFLHTVPDDGMKAIPTKESKSDIE